MTFLSDADIRLAVRNRWMVIEPYDPALVQNNSYLLTSNEQVTIHRLKHKNIWTKEEIKLPNTIVGFLTARTSIARQGLFFATSIGVDAGFCGHLVVELFNVANHPITVMENDAIVHLWFAFTSSPCTPYRGKYQNQKPESDLKNV